MRFASSGIWVVVCLVAALSAGAPSPALAQDSDALNPALRLIGTSGRVVVPHLRVVTASDLAAAPSAMPLLRSGSRRPRAFLPMYGALAGLNALDVHSTYAGLKVPGTRETNPVIAPLVDHPAAYIAVKAATTGAFIWTAEKLRKKHPVAAVIAAAAANTAAALVVAHNYRIARR